jgi:hypothetical protein
LEKKNLNWKKNFEDGFKWVAQAGTGIPDRVPTYAQLCELLTEELGEPSDKIFHDPKLLAEGTFKVCDRYGIDVPSVDFDTYNIEAEAIGQSMVFHKDIAPDVNRSNSMIKDKSDLKKIKTPDFNTAGRCRMVVDLYHLILEETGQIPSLAFCAPFSLAANIRGLSPLLMDIMTNPSFAKELFQRINEELLIPWLEYLHGFFPETPAIVGADAMASLPMVNERIMEEWLVPGIGQLQEVVGPKVCVPNWTGERYSKNPEKVMDFRRKVNPGFIQGQDPDIEVLGPEFYRDYADKHDLPLLLGIGAVFLNDATPEEVEARVKHYVEVGNRDGKLWFYLCNLSPTTPKDNIKAAVSALHKYGTLIK